MAFELVENITRADIAVHLSGDDLNELFVSGAHALLSVMVGNPDSVVHKTEREVGLENPEIDLLLFDFLHEIIFFKDSESLLLLPDKLFINRRGETFFLESVLSGEPIDNRRHELLTDVKAVTMHNLKVARSDERWTGLVVIDV